MHVCLENGFQNARVYFNISTVNGEVNIKRELLYLLPDELVLSDLNPVLWIIHSQSAWEELRDKEATQRVDTASPSHDSS